MKAEEYLNQIPMWTREKNSLEDIRTFLEYLGNPDRQIPVIHVAGTNGKGSVCACLTYALRRAGYRVGTFVSPHLVELRERFLLNGEMAEEEELEQCFLQVKEAADVLSEKGLHHPTFFEFLFYMAALLYSREKVDFWVMETGLGGRLDTTNVIERPLVSVITSVSLDHTKYLGNTIREIAGEKAGIIKEGIPVVYDANSEEAAEVVKARAEMLHAETIPVCRRDFSFYVEKGFSLAEKDFSSAEKDFSSAEKEFPSAEKDFSSAEKEFFLAEKEFPSAVKEFLPAETGSGGESREGIVLEFVGKKGQIRLPFKAAYQADNGALAWKTLEVLTEKGQIGKEREALLRLGMEETRWPGRMEEIMPGVFLDGAHNPGGMEAFVRAAKAVTKGKKGKIFVLFAAVADKDYRDMVQCLWRELKPDFAVAVCLDNQRSLGLNELKGLLEQEMGCAWECFEEVKTAFDFLLKKKGSHDYLFCVGSLYLIGEIKALKRRPKGDAKYHD